MKICEICGGTISSGTTTTICSSCTHIRESTTASRGSLEDHICGCINTDRRNCPLCKKPCHHDTSLNPKILISPIWYITHNYFGPNKKWCYTRKYLYNSFKDWIWDVLDVVNVQKYSPLFYNNINKSSVCTYLFILNIWNTSKFGVVPTELLYYRELNPAETATYLQ